MIKKIFRFIVDLVKEEYRFFIFLILLYILFMMPVNYYIVVGGGTSDVASRIVVEDGYKSKGTFNISYVEELKGTVFTYLLSYVVPNWEREDANDYKYSDDESIEDIEFRGNLDLKTANGNATYWAYKLANKEIKKSDSKLYIISVFDDYETDLKLGDQVLSIDGNTYDSIDEYRNYIQTKEEESKVLVKVIRKGKEKEIKTKVYKYKDTLILGVALQFVRNYETDPTVNINFKGGESGPSGGLITTLEIYNQLTKKDITKGLKIVGTGTIEEDGTIGTIGGVTHKLIGAEDAKADIFLVPSGKNYKTAVKYKKDKKLKIKIIEVESIEDAIDKLSKEVK